MGQMRALLTFPALRALLQLPESTTILTVEHDVESDRVAIVLAHAAIPDSVPGAPRPDGELVYTQASPFQGFRLYAPADAEAKPS